MTRITHLIDFLIKPSFILSLLLVGLTLLVFYPVIHYDHTNWDDQLFIIGNPYLRELSWSNILAIFTPGKIEGELIYIPITYLSFFADRCWSDGLSSSTIHAGNLLLHLLNVMLVYYLVVTWKSSPLIAFFTAGFFAIHPLQVEAVAWMMGRKEVLSTFLMLLATVNYQNFIRHSRRKYYLSAIITFGLAVLAKPTMMVGPVIFILILYYHQQSDRSQLMWVMPFFILSVAVIIINRHISVISDNISPGHFWYRLQFLPHILAGWVKRLLLFDDPNVVYLWKSAAVAEHIVLFDYVLIFALGFIIFNALVSGQRTVAFGLLWGVITFLPSTAIYLMAEREYITADRYGYFPLIGLFFALFTAWRCHQPLVKKVLLLMLLTGLAISLHAAKRQVAIWENSETLWQYALEQDPANPMACNLLGNYYLTMDNFASGREWHRRAIQHQPDYLLAYINLAWSFARTNDFARAEKYYLRALRIQHDNIAALLGVARVYMEMNKFDQAIFKLQYLLQRDPTHFEACYNLGLIYKQLGQSTEAYHEFSRAAAINPQFEKAHFKLAVMDQAEGRYPQASERYLQVLELNPDNYEAHFNLAMVCIAMRQPDQALKHLLKFETLKPNDTDLNYFLGVINFQRGEYYLAIACWLQSLEMNPDLTLAWRDVGNAWLQLGNTSEAKKYYERALAEGVPVDENILKQLQ